MLPETSAAAAVYSIYEIRLVNSATQMGYQGIWVSHLTTGIPMF